MGLRRRDHNVIQTKNPEKENFGFQSGDLTLVMASKKFPITLREGPGYIFQKIVTVESEQIGIAIDKKTGHGAISWVQLLCLDKILGWVPESLVHYIKNF